MNLPDTLKERIVKQTMESMGSLLTEEELRTMVEEAIQAFISPKLVHLAKESTGNSYYSQPQNTLAVYASPFTIFVWRQIKDRIDVMLKEVFEEEQAGVAESARNVVKGQQVKEAIRTGAYALAPEIARVQSLNAIHETLRAMANRMASVPHSPFTGHTDFIYGNGAIPNVFSEDGR